MMKEKRTRSFFVTYDGIENSVFQSQVLNPLLLQLKQNKNLSVVLVSFEKKRPSNALLKKLIPAHERLHFVLCRKIPYWGLSSLRLAVYQLRKLMLLLHGDHVTARGPFAGFIAQKALEKLFLTKTFLQRKECFIPSLTIQARGLCGEEYRYVAQNQRQSFAHKALWRLRYKSFVRLEEKVFGKTSLGSEKIVIEAVSPALKQYLVDKFNVPNDHVVISKVETCSFDKSKNSHCRNTIRLKHNIAQDDIVYCYNGSYKPWQCIQETICYVAEQYKKNVKSFLLILSPDVDQFRQEVEKSCLPRDRYVILSVAPNDIVTYLSIADYGILFRKNDVVNWVARPTKMLEYQAAGLPIIHNGSVALLKEHEGEKHYTQVGMAA